MPRSGIICRTMPQTVVLTTSKKWLNSARNGRAKWAAANKQSGLSAAAGLDFSAESRRVYSSYHRLSNPLSTRECFRSILFTKSAWFKRETNCITYVSHKVSALADMVKFVGRLVELSRLIQHKPNLLIQAICFSR